jgi:hypothetical protein
VATWLKKKARETRMTTHNPPIDSQSPALFDIDFLPA